MDKFANEPLVNKNFKEYLINAYVLNINLKKDFNLVILIELMIFVKQKNSPEMVQN